ncbi:MAG: hypothetical protein LBQ98_05655, partial [Nitrososphaerota archaeon]|nr:hypothetical protein [Nitrososphaerota archaeon]
SCECNKQPCEFKPCCECNKKPCECKPCCECNKKPCECKPCNNDHENHYKDQDHNHTNNETDDQSRGNEEEFPAKTNPENDKENTQPPENNQNNTQPPENNQNNTQTVADNTSGSIATKSSQSTPKPDIALPRTDPQNSPTQAPLSPRVVADGLTLSDLGWIGAVLAVLLGSIVTLLIINTKRPLYKKKSEC